MKIEVLGWLIVSRSGHGYGLMTIMTELAKRDWTGQEQRQSQSQGAKVQSEGDRALTRGNPVPLSPFNLSPPNPLLLGPSQRLAPLLLRPSASKTRFCWVGRMLLPGLSQHW